MTILSESISPLTIALVLSRSTAISSELEPNPIQLMSKPGHEKTISQNNVQFCFVVTINVESNYASDHNVSKITKPFTKKLPNYQNYPLNRCRSTKSTYV
jgi:hypothetical protein